MAQIEALLAEKESRSPTERKIDSQLLYGLRMRLGQAVAPGVDRVETRLPYAANGHVLVDVSANASNNVAAAVRLLGGKVLSSSADNTRFRIQIPINAVKEIAARTDVEFVRPPQDAHISRIPPKGTAARLTLRHVEVARALGSVLGGSPQQTAITATQSGQGSRTSEGVIAHRVFLARPAFDVRGQDVKVGVISDGVTHLADSQQSGDLGNVIVLPGQAGFGDEGTAMLEIVHDVAPEATLYFATGTAGLQSLANNIRELAKAGCDIIVDDISYPEESPFQDGQADGVSSTTNGGIAIQAVKDVTAGGVLYFSSAGNVGNLTHGTSGVWEGDFAEGSVINVSDTSGRVRKYNFHLFGPDRTRNKVVTAKSLAPVTLHWSDPLGRSANDYDLFLLNAAGTGVLASSTNTQSGSQDPYEQVPQVANGQIIIVKRAAVDAVPALGLPAVPASFARYLHLDTNGGVLEVATSGAIRGHAAVDSVGAYGVAAAPVEPTLTFSAGDAVEAFSADGPRRIFFEADGTAITPGNFLAASNGGRVLQKPDFTAADGVSVSGAGDFRTLFFGTSAAAPHAAGIAALLKSAASQLAPQTVLTAETIRNALVTSAIDIEAAGVDRDSGAGIIGALESLRGLGISGPALVPEILVAESPGNGNGTPDAGEGVRAEISIANYGSVSATAVSMSLSTTTPGISIEQLSTRTYDQILPGNESPKETIRFSVASDFPCPRAASFSLKINYAGITTARQFDFEVPIGMLSYSISKKLDESPAPASAGVSTFNGVQASRLNRDGAAKGSLCGVQKQPPSVLSAPGGRQFDAYTFATCEQSLPACVTVNVRGPNAINLFAAAYSPSFTPADVRQNYLADPGASGPFQTFSFALPAGRQSFAIDIHDVASTVASGTAYTVTVAGACMGACDPPNHVPVARAKDLRVEADPVTGDASVSVDSGSSDPDADALTLTQSPPGPYVAGVTQVVLTATDPRGAFSQANAVITVDPFNHPPVAKAKDVRVEADEVTGVASVSVDDGSSDPDGDVLSFAQAPAGPYPIGITHVVFTATDARGKSSEAAATVTVDSFNHPPVARAKDVRVEADEITGVATVSVDNGSTDADGDTLSFVQTPVGPYPIGSTPVVLTVTDARGKSSDATATITVVAFNRPPVAQARNATVVADPVTGLAAASIDNGSFDPEGDPIVVTQTPAGPYRFGSTAVVLTATDARGRSSQARATVTVLDQTAPTISAPTVSKQPDPANRDWFIVTLSYTTFDNVGPVSCTLLPTLLSVDSAGSSANRFDSAGAISGSKYDGTNWIVIDANHVKLNASRSGEGNSRTYALTVKARDTAANETSQTVFVTVRRD